MEMIVPTVNSVGDAALTNSIIDKSITEIQDELVTDIRENAFHNCAALKKAVFGSVSKVADRAFDGCTALTTADFHAVTSLGDYAFNNCFALTALFLRGATVCHAVSGTFQNSGIASGNGYIYVPAALLDAYKAHSGWGQYASQIHPIEGYTVTWANTDGTVLEVDTGVQAGTIPTYNGSTPVDTVNGNPFTGWEPAVEPITGDTIYTPVFQDIYNWEAVQASIEAGDYATKYSVGDTVPLDLGDEGIINMQIAGFDTETLADGTGKAAITWFGLELLANTTIMNYMTKGTNGGWGECKARTYLTDTVQPLIPEEVQSMIKTVVKTQAATDTSDALFTQTTNDALWIPSTDEVSYDNTGKYPQLFSAYADRKKVLSGTTTNTDWWLRDASSGDAYHYIKATGVQGYITVYRNYGICLCFCTGRTPT